MKKALILMVCLLATTMMYAQNRTNLKGPKAKHYKPWQDRQNAQSEADGLLAADEGK